jgi:hypothetical protein
VHRFEHEDKWNFIYRFEIEVVDCERVDEETKMSFDFTCTCLDGFLKCADFLENN